MLKPVDIDNYTFKKAAIGGYDVDSVEDFMEQLSEDYATIYESYEESESKIKDLEKQIEELQKNEVINSIKEDEEVVEEGIVEVLETEREEKSAVSMDEIETIKKNALIEAEEIIEQATAAAKQNVKEIELEIKQKQKEFENVKKEVQMFNIRFEAMLQTQLKILKTKETK